MIESRLTARSKATDAKTFLRKAIGKVRLHRPIMICTDWAPMHCKVIQGENRRYDSQFDASPTPIRNSETAALREMTRRRGGRSDITRFFKAVDLRSQHSAA
ncbi:hypothetical protein [Palleronia pontilimi]|uniref:hypothetical protein n=1 Tax=Palleronia pontilimi TaxID=1964209 RepID=UPI001F23F710|nr:hypothetical protein [Palleronia pontilimi]